MIRIQLEIDCGRAVEAVSSVAGKPCADRRGKRQGYFFAQHKIETVGERLVCIDNGFFDPLDSHSGLLQLMSRALSELDKLD